MVAQVARKVKNSSQKIKDLTTQPLLRLIFAEELRPITSEEFRLLRHRLGFNQSEYAALIGIKQTTVSSYEKMCPKDLVPLNGYQRDLLLGISARLKQESSPLEFGQDLKGKICGGLFKLIFWISGIKV